MTDIPLINAAPAVFPVKPDASMKVSDENSSAQISRLIRDDTHCFSRCHIADVSTMFAQSTSRVKTKGRGLTPDLRISSSFLRAGASVVTREQ